MATIKKEFKPIPAFKDHSNCQGHANAVLDCTFEYAHERKLLSDILTNYIEATQWATD